MKADDLYFVVAGMDPGGVSFVKATWTAATYCHGGPDKYGRWPDHEELVRTTGEQVAWQDRASQVSNGVYVAFRLEPTKCPADYPYVGEARIIVSALARDFSTGNVATHHAYLNAGALLAR